MEMILKGIAKIVTLIEELIGEIRLLRQEQEKTNKWLRNHDTDASIIIAELLKQTGYQESTKNSSYVTQTTQIRMLNHLTKGEDSL